MSDSGLAILAPALPLPRAPITIRPGEARDVPFLDSLQKIHTKQVGWMPTKQLEGKIKLGHVLVAEEVNAGGRVGLGLGVGAGSEATPTHTPNHTHNPIRPLSAPTPVGYCIGHDQYFKRDDCGIIYQLNVVPNKQRGFIGATLLKAMFERAAWGCRLFCCWCAQDIEANRFWESIGFVPLAFRAGSRTKGAGGTPRVHIFWQKRIREGDTTTPWWFPSQTSSGSIREDRLVFPIPPGVHWKDAMPIVLPGDGSKRLDAPESKQKPKASTVKPAPISRGLWFAVPKPLTRPRTKRERRVAVKNDPRFVAAARELRDRWLEEVNSGRYLALEAGKYDVARSLSGREHSTAVIGMLPQAA